MKILIFTPMYPSTDDPHNGTFVYDEKQALEKLKLDIRVLHIDSKNSKVNYIKALPELKRVMKEFKPDIIHCHHTFCVFIAWISGGKNIVATFHESEYTSKESYITLLKREGIGKFIALSKPFKRFCLRKARHIFDITGLLEDSEKVTTPFNPGIDPDTFHPIDKHAAKESIGWDLNKKYILFPGDPACTCKRYDIANDIFNMVKDMVAWPMELFPLTGVPHDDVSLYMNASDVMLLVSDYEASPMVVKEAVACGLPSVCYNVGDVARVLEGVPRTFVIKPDKKMAANLIKELLKNIDFERKSHLHEKYTTKYVADRIYNVYQQIV